MFSFLEKIKYKCLKHNKKYIKVNEAYTTKLCVNCGFCNEIGSNKKYDCEKCKKVYDRDVKSAGCIYLKELKKYSDNQDFSCFLFFKEIVNMSFIICQ